MDAAVLQKMTLELLQTEKYSYAEVIARQWVSASPKDMLALKAFARSMIVQDKWPELLKFFFDHANQHESNDDVRLLLGHLLRVRGIYTEAEFVVKDYLLRHPDSAEALKDYCVILLHTSRVRLAEPLIRRALELTPTDVELWSWLMEAIDYNPEYDAARSQAEKKRWNEKVIAPLRDFRRPHSNDRDPDRVLRVGYLSPNFYEVSPARIFGPIMWAQDRSKFPLICLNAGPKDPVDAFGARFRKEADEWHDIGGALDSDVAEYIRRMRIDILVDLSGHGEGNRLELFGLKPAPIQVSAWSFATGTGAETMDYLFADGISLPASEHKFFAERIANLPCVLCFGVPSGAPAVSPAPAQSMGFVTFGSFNRIQKIDDQTVSLWSEILLRVPHSRLVIKDIQLDLPFAIDFMISRFAASGIGAERLLLLGRSNHFDHMSKYDQVDIGLDPLAHGGALTTCEALAMGVPTVCLYGNSLARRQTFAINNLLGLDAFNTQSLQDYADCAVGWANRLEELATLRAGLRERYEASSLGNPNLYVRHVEAGYRQMWRNWCATAPEI